MTKAQSKTVESAPVETTASGGTPQEAAALAAAADAQPQFTRKLSDYTYSPLPIGRGRPMPLGATPVPNGVNFSVFSKNADGCVLVLFRKGEAEPFAEIRFPDEFRVGKVFCMTVYDLNHRQISYGFRMFGPWEPQRGHRFNPDQILIDPYAQAITGRGKWRERRDLFKSGNPYPYRGRIPSHDFDWQGDRPLHLPIEDLVIYEMHVRGFTAHETSGVHFPGTYGGLVEKIPYLKALGVNAVELLPVYDFDELNNSPEVPPPDALINYWGYSTVNFFAPKAGFAAGGESEGEVDEFKYMVRELHRAGIEVILDVVFNHTAEGNEHGPTISFKGVDNQTYYMLTPEGYYYNFSGTGNTFNCNQPAVIQFIIDALRHWVTEYHIDGFRFDLASILARREDGTPLGDPPLLKTIAHDPVLGRTKLIAEPWDAGGLYHVGGFPDYGRWGEWNGKYRDAIRKFVRSDAGTVPEMIQRIMGSPDLYPTRGPIASINFVIAHDGFTLNDLFSYNDKHNEANGEDNRDGANDNNSWNCGVEGPTDDPEILRLRRRLMKNTIAILLVSQGVPMLQMGDEIARTQNGNNNAYCQDNAISYMDWSTVEANAEIFNFHQQMIAFRHRHPVLRHGYHLRGTDYQNAGMADITWLDVDLAPNAPVEERLTMAFVLSGKHAKGGLTQDEDLFVAMNMHWNDQYFSLPHIEGQRWFVFVNTGVDAPHDICEPGQEVELSDQQHLMLTSRSVIILVSRPVAEAANADAAVNGTVEAADA
ncbi:MAG: glycogen debranching protein GlgX [bacterium]|nr:glycogen debranching protein GlgX [bacterium]